MNFDDQLERLFDVLARGLQKAGTVKNAKGKVDWGPGVKSRTDTR